MPELPEVEIVRRALSPHVLGRKIARVEVHQARLRYPISDHLAPFLCGQEVVRLERRSKYIIFHGSNAPMFVIHLGMTGRCFMLSEYGRPSRHDHLDIFFDDRTLLRYQDMRRFGAVLLWDAAKPRIDALGAEPWSDLLTSQWCQQQSQRRFTPIKPWLMDGRHIAGIGNIYASEGLFLAGILPSRPVSSITEHEWDTLIERLRMLLERAIALGGSTLRDFLDPHGQKGYFQQEYFVYGRAGQTCHICDHPIQNQRIAQRSSAFCAHCQH